MFSSIINELNFFGNGENKDFRKCFWIFFIIAICSYLSIMTSHYPHQDDYCRYIVNYTCSLHSRGLIRLLEEVLYSSEYITDITPFTQILSCGMLAYSAVILMKILNASYNDWLCFVPVVVNPFIVECMLFKFDNFFMIVAIFFAVAAAYVASKNLKENILPQAVLLFCSLTTYQAAIHIYGVIFIYKLMQEIRSKLSIPQTIYKMRYWIYATAITSIVVIPIRLASGSYGADKNGNFFIIPNDAERVKNILSNFLNYFCELKNDWSCNGIGILTFILLFFFVIVIFKKCYSDTRSVNKVLFVACLSILFFIMPYGFVAFSHYTNSKLFIPPRILYAFCFVISIAFFELYKTFYSRKLLRVLLKCSFCFWAIWNITFANSIGNIHHQQEKLCSQIAMNLAEDIYSLFPKNKEHYYIHFTNEAITPSAHNFAAAYPIANKIVLIKNWPPAYLFAMWFYKTDLPQLDDILYPEKVSISTTELEKAKLIKSGMLYDVYLCEKDEKKIIYVTFKSSEQHVSATTMIPLDVSLLIKPDLNNKIQP